MEPLRLLRTHWQLMTIQQKINTSLNPHQRSLYFQQMRLTQIPTTGPEWRSVCADMAHFPLLIARLMAQI